MSLAPRTRLGTYEILAHLGSGGMGDVYRAMDLRLGREIALKILRPDVASSPSRLARLEHEARTAAGLNHPNIVTLFSVEDHDGLRFLTMELVRGVTLTDRITPGGLPVSEVIELSTALADALIAAHERGVIHRDLKPANVMVTPEGRVKVLDFGLAETAAFEVKADEETRTDSSRLSSMKSEAGRPAGTLAYMAPEQIRGEGVDARSDLFSLGIIIYELATGRRPFSGGTWADAASSILRDTPESLRGARADLPPQLDRVVTWCLEKDPRDRAQTAREVYDELRRLEQSLERTAPSRATVPGVASIAVLPFANRSRAEEDDYFSDGLADELLDTLGKIRGLRVAARTSSFQFKGTKPDLAAIGRRLNVAAVLDGSVRKSNNRVRISVQLVEVSGGYCLWSETYDRTLDDVFEVQDDIAQSVVRQLRGTLLGENVDGPGQVHVEVASAAKGRSTDPEAHRLYLLARHLQARWTREDTANAIQHLRHALERDPRFALGWAELCRAYRSQADQTWVTVAEGYECARKAAERALALEPDLPEAHARMAWIQMSYDWDWRGAKASYDRALELAPRSSSALLGAGLLARYLGNIDEAIELHRRILEQDPLSGAAYHNLGWILHDAGRFAEAVEVYRNALELAPQRVITRAQLALSLAALGRSDDALFEARREPEEAYRLWALAIVHSDLAQRPESDASLRALTDRHADTCAYQIAEAHGARGEVDDAFQWLERAYALRDGGLSHMLASPRLRSLHGDPRWDAFLGKMGFVHSRPD